MQQSTSIREDTGVYMLQVLERVSALFRVSPFGLCYTSRQLACTTTATHCRGPRQDRFLFPFIVFFVFWWSSRLMARLKMENDASALDSLLLLPLASFFNACKDRSPFATLGGRLPFPSSVSCADWDAVLITLFWCLGCYSRSF